MRPTTPDFAAAYGNFPVDVTNAWIEAIVTIDPRRWLAHLRAARASRSATPTSGRSPRKSSHSSSVIVAASNGTVDPRVRDDDVDRAEPLDRERGRPAPSAPRRSRRTRRTRPARARPSAPRRPRAPASRVDVARTRPPRPPPAAARRTRARSRARRRSRTPPVPSSDVIALPVQQRAVGREREMRRRRPAGVGGRDLFDELDADPRSAWAASRSRPSSRAAGRRSPRATGRRRGPVRGSGSSAARARGGCSPSCRSGRSGCAARRTRSDGLGQRGDPPELGDAAAVADVRLDHGARARLSSSSRNSSARGESLAGRDRDRERARHLGHRRPRPPAGHGSSRNHGRDGSSARPSSIAVAGEVRPWRSTMMSASSPAASRTARDELLGFADARPRPRAAAAGATGYTFIASNPALRAARAASAHASGSRASPPSSEPEVHVRPHPVADRARRGARTAEPRAPSP